MNETESKPAEPSLDEKCDRAIQHYRKACDALPDMHWHAFVEHSINHVRECPANLVSEALRMVVVDTSLHQGRLSKKGRQLALDALLTSKMLAKAYPLLTCAGKHHWTVGEDGTGKQEFCFECGIRKP